MPVPTDNPKVMKRTPEEMQAAREQRKEVAVANAQARVETASEPPIPPLVRVVGDPKRMERIEAAAEALSPSDPLAVVRLAMLEAGIPVPAATTVWEFLAELQRRYGYRPMPACLATPLPGSLYVECDENHEPVRVGIVAKVKKGEDGETDRSRFFRAATSDRETPLFRVEFFLLHPSGCAPCAQRKRQAAGSEGKG